MLHSKQKLVITKVVSYKLLVYQGTSSRLESGSCPPVNASECKSRAILKCGSLLISAALDGWDIVPKSD